MNIIHIFYLRIVRFKGSIKKAREDPSP